MDKNRLEFHIESDDYFATLATVLDLFRQNFKRKEYREDTDEALADVRKELLYLQKYYSIVKKHDSPPLKMVERHANGDSGAKERQES